MTLTWDTTPTPAERDAFDAAALAYGVRVTWAADGLTCTLTGPARVVEAMVRAWRNAGAPIVAMLAGVGEA